MKNSDLKTKGYIVRRVNYGEADRILNIITPIGLVTAIAKGVRKSKSKLAGSVELFSLVDFNIHQGKSEFGVVTSARMIKYDGNIIADLNRMNLAGMVLKKISKVAESSDNAEFFKIVDQVLDELNNGMDAEIVENWFVLNLMKAVGEEINLYRDINGKKLSEEERYNWDALQEVFIGNEDGMYGANEIKMLRLLYTADLNVVKRVKLEKELKDKVVSFVRMVDKTR